MSPDAAGERIGAESRGRYEALRTGAVAAALRRSLIRLGGADAFDFLHRMSTNDLAALPDGDARRTVILNEKGRIVDIVTVRREGSDALLVGSPGAGKSVADWLGKFIIMDDVRILSVSDEIAIGAAYGPGAGHVAAALSAKAMIGSEGGGGAGASPLSSTGRKTAGPAVGRAGILREDLGSIPGYLIVPPGEGKGGDPAAGAGLTRRGPGAPLMPVDLAIAGESVIETARIEEGVPRLGSELGPEVNALEGGLKAYVSFTKGCYIGQEVIARLDTYRKLRKILSLFTITGSPGDALQPGVLRRGGEEAGRITSVTWSHLYSGWIGLGFRRTGAHAESLEIFPGDAGVSAECRVLKGAMPGYEEYEIEQ